MRYWTTEIVIFFFSASHMIESPDDRCHDYIHIFGLKRLCNEDSDMPVRLLRHDEVLKARKNSRYSFNDYGYTFKDYCEEACGM